MTEGIHQKFANDSHLTINLINYNTNHSPRNQWQGKPNLPVNSITHWRKDANAPKLLHKLSNNIVIFVTISL